MNTNSRTYNSISNTMYGIITQTITILLSFVTRSVFIKYLSIDYLGVNGLFTNILTILSLAELGFGSAIIYSMYKPLAENDVSLLSALMALYSKVYKVIGCVVAIIGISIIPFLDVIIKNPPEVGSIKIIYILFLINSVSSYFFAYKRAIIQADQKQRVISKNRLLFSMFKMCAQISILIITKSYILFLAIQILFTLLENLVISRIANKLYPFLKGKSTKSLSGKETREIWTNVKALMIYKIGSTILDGTDNIIISTYIGVSSVGLLSNYTLIIGSVSMLLVQLSSAITGSVGNYMAKENSDKQEELLYKITFVYYIFYGYSFVALFLLLNPFITLWIGEKYLLSNPTVFVMSINWYIYGMISPVWTFRSTLGLFVHGKYRPAISAVINVGVSIILAKELGVIGVLLGTTITRLVTNSWYDPYIVYKHGLKASPVKYYLIQVKYAVTLLVVSCMLSYGFSMLPSLNIITFIVRIIVILLIMPLVTWLVFHKRDEFNYLIEILKRIITTGYKKFKSIFS